MYTAQLSTLFSRMGARLQLGEIKPKDARARNQPLTLDVGSDAAGEFFDIRLRPGASLELDVIDLRRRDRHLLLRARSQPQPFLPVRT